MLILSQYTFHNPLPTPQNGEKMSGRNGLFYDLQHILVILHSSFSISPAITECGSRNVLSQYVFMAQCYSLQNSTKQGGGGGGSERHERAVLAGRIKRLIKPPPQRGSYNEEQGINQICKLIVCLSSKRMASFTGKRLQNASLRLLPLCQTLFLSTGSTTL